MIKRYAKDRFLKILLCNFTACCISFVGAAQNADLKDILTAPISIDRPTELTSIPMSVRGGKLYIEASVNGTKKEFFFDTGSPTILSRALADDLDLDIIGQNTGRDANGTEIVMDYAIVRDITLGDITFHNVPVLIHDFSKIPLGSCYFEGGVIGSEILPGSAWKIDTEAEELQIGSSLEAFAISPGTYEVPLQTFGYPHAPILDYSIGEFSDKALFDTGSSSQISLFRDIMKDKSVIKAINNKTVQTGKGIEGVSAGGVGTMTELNRFELKEFNLDTTALGPVQVITKSIPPSLIGTGLLQFYNITLDYTSMKALLEPRPIKPSVKPQAGFSISIVDGAPKVTQLFKNSPADLAGLKLNDRVLDIDGRSLSASTETKLCENSLWLTQAFESASAKVITVERGTKQIQIHMGDVSP